MPGAAEGTGVGGPGRLLERQDELAVLDRSIDGSLAGRAGLLLVEGPAGIGKSRLIAEARRLAAARGLLVHSARGSRLEREFPFGVVRQLFEPRLAERGLRERILSGAAASSATVFGFGDGAADSPSGSGTFAALHGLYWLTLDLAAEAPLLLAIDDLHWCDRTSLQFLGYLVRRLDDAPVLVVASLRPADPGADDALIAEFVSDPLAQKLGPRPLSLDATAVVIRDRLGESPDTAFTAACHATTGGNPLFLNELLKTLADERVTPGAASASMVSELGPRAVSRAVLLRLARLSPGAVAMARSLAVLGDGADTGVVAALAGLDDATMAAAGKELVRAEIVRPVPPLGFVHPVVQAAIHRDLAPGERELSHERAARLLYSLDAPPEQIAAHLLVIPRQGEDWVVDVLRAAAQTAFAKGAPDSAIASLQRALDEPLPSDLRPQILFELGRAQSLMSLPDSMAALRAAYEGSREPALRAHAADWLACTLHYMDAPDEAAEIAHLAVRELPAHLEDLGRLIEAGELISLFFGARDDEGERSRRLRGHRTIDTDLGPGAKALAAVAAWEWAESGGPAELVVALARAALSDGTLMTAEAGELVIGAILPLALADLDEAVDRWDDVKAEARRSGDLFTMLTAQAWGGYTQYLRGDLAEAETELRGALVTVDAWGVPSQRPWASSVLVDLLIDRGAVDEARALLEASVDPHPGSESAVLLDRARMRVLLAEGRTEEALAWADTVQEHAAWRRHPRYVPWRSLKAQALDRLGRMEEALGLAMEEVEIARAWGSPGTLGRSLRVLGTLERDEGLDHLREACALLERVPARLEYGKALAALGESLRRARRPSEAREPLLRAHELAQICRATTLVERTRTELYAAGARPRRSALHGVQSLTASERRVADLAAAGHSNRDIAQALYVTPKTVEVHLSSAYRKLGIDTRRDLPQALTARG